MKLLFLTLVNIDSINERNLYTDLMRKFRNEGHEVYIVTPIERRYKKNTTFEIQDGITILKIRTLNIQKTNILEKGIATLLIEFQYLNGIKKLISDVKFDLILYSTPPITFSRVIKYIKHRDKAISYLLLKDIFPQNAVDLGLIKKGGLIHKYFRKKEKKLYDISDFIGCMSPANVDYILKHNPEIKHGKVEVNPNSIEPDNKFFSLEEKRIIKKKYNVPENVITFIYGGNLGKPQGIDFMIEVLTSIKDRKDLFFIIVGNGTEYLKLEKWVKLNLPKNVLLLPGLPKLDYDRLLQTCDVGFIFLDKRFTIPNFPSRLLSYMEYKMPIIAVTDPNSDIGKVIELNHFGYWINNCEISAIIKSISRFVENDELIKVAGENGYNYLNKHYKVDESYNIIVNHL